MFGYRAVAAMALAWLLVQAGPATSADPGPPAAGVRTIVGDWDGALNVSAVKLRLAFHVTTGATGLTGTLDSIDQQANGIPLTRVEMTGDKVHIEIAAVRGTFDGVLDSSGGTLTGEWRQGPGALPLELTRRAAGQAQAVLRRPQTPVKPYPYREEEVAFADAAANVRLSGTLTLPEGAGPFPAVVLVAGSGPNTRNEPIVGHELFLVLADHLTRHGIAVLRYDKRGTGRSTGDYGKATSYDFADDARAAAAYLRTRGEIDPGHVGLIGHSEGGLIVPMVAVRDPSTAFIVMLAGPGVNGAAVWLEQLKLILAAAGMAPDKIAVAAGQRQRMIDILRSEPDPDKAAPLLHAVMREQAPQATPAQIDGVVAQINNRWFREFFAYEPAPVLRQVRCPVLVLGGTKDVQVSTAQNLPRIREALSGNPDVEIDEIPGLNHLFQTARTGAISEYSEIEETMAPVALDTVARWIRAHSRPPGAP